jgi:hypothetical protein
VKQPSRRPTRRMPITVPVWYALIGAAIGRRERPL